MANGCSVTYKIVGNKKELNDLKNVCDFVMSKYTGRLVSFIYLYDEYKYDYESDWKTSCWIDNVSLNEDVLTLKSTYNWCMDECFYKFLQHTYPNLNVLYEEFEPNGLIYNTNDKDKKFFKNRYWIQCWNKENFDWQFFENEEDLFKFVREFSEDDKINNMEDVLNYIKELKDIQEEKRNGNRDNDKLLTLIEKEIIDLNKLYENE